MQTQQCAIRWEGWSHTGRLVQPNLTWHKQTQQYAIRWGGGLHIIIIILIMASLMEPKCNSDDSYDKYNK